MEYKNYIEGKRIYLRDVKTSDVNQDYCGWMNDPEVNQYLETRHTIQTLDSIMEYVKRLEGNKDEIFFAICLKENGKHIGNIKIGPINQIHKYADISLVIGDKNQWGKGFATEAIKLITGYAFQTLNLNKLRAGCYEQNEGSKKAFEKAGYTVESIFKNQYLFNGKYVNSFSLVIFNNK
jgi:[ribosomal protein S5]-alanine N-acetyltransferase